MAMLDDLDQFAAEMEQEKSRLRSPVQRWFDEHPDLAQRLLQGYHQQEYSIAVLFAYAAKHGFPRKRCAFDNWLKANRPT
jgi:predicted translin family RNA/ssDNA-binding protein